MTGTMPAAVTSWREDFRLLWTAQTVSAFGSQITTVALPLTAAALLHASPLQMGMLASASTLPNLLFSFYLGAVADRVAKRWKLLVWADVVRMVLLGLIPLAALGGFLSVNLLILLGFLAGTVSLSFGITVSAFLPSVVPAGSLLSANARMQGTMTISGLAGMSLAGVLVEVFGAPNAMAIDAASFAASAVFLVKMRRRDGMAAPRPPREAMWRSVLEGLRYTLTEPRLRAIVGAATNLNLFSSIALALGVLYLNRDLGMPPYLISLVLCAWGVGAVAGTMLATRLGRRYGEGRTITAASAVFSVALFVYPPISGPVWFEATALAITNMTLGCAVFVFDVHSAALRQGITPDHIQGRTASTMAFLTQGVKPLGGLLGGVLGEALSVRGAFWVAAAGCATTVLWTYTSPLRGPADSAALASQDGVSAEEANH